MNGYKPYNMENLANKNSNKNNANSYSLIYDRKKLRQLQETFPTLKTNAEREENLKEQRKLINFDDI